MRGPCVYHEFLDASSLSSSQGSKGHEYCVQMIEVEVEGYIGMKASDMVTRTHTLELSSHTTASTSVLQGKTDDDGRPGS